MKIKRIPYKYKQLEQMFGGKWKYNRHGSLWECNDGKRMVWGVCSYSCDYNCGSSSRYYMYGGEKTVEVNFIGQSFSMCNRMPS